MNSERGFSYVEMLVIVGLIGIAAAVTIPSMSGALERNRVITSTDLVAAQIRSARLAAISRNARFDVRFDCPTVGAVRTVAWTGNPTIDNATDRCSNTVENDGPPVYLPPGVSFGTVPTLQINGRGQIGAASGTMPLSINFSHESITRTLVVTASGRVSTPGS